MGLSDKDVSRIHVRFIVLSYPPPSCLTVLNCC